MIVMTIILQDLKPCQHLTINLEVPKRQIKIQCSITKLIATMKPLSLPTLTSPDLPPLINSKEAIQIIQATNYATSLFLNFQIINQNNVEAIFAQATCRHCYQCQK
jgi:hypothetical protein